MCCFFRAVSLLCVHWSITVKIVKPDLCCLWNQPNPTLNDKTLIDWEGCDITHQVVSTSVTSHFTSIRIVHEHTHAHQKALSLRDRARRRCNRLQVQLYYIIMYFKGMPSSTTKPVVWNPRTCHGIWLHGSTCLNKKRMFEDHAFPFRVLDSRLL